MLTLHLPAPENTVPLLLDSPHSGREFPADFVSLATAEELQTAWDAWVAELWGVAVAQGASLLEARFPRVIIDPNRASDDIDPALLTAAWPKDWGALAPTAYSQRGMGLIRRDILPGRAMYATGLSPQQIRWRLDTMYRPYHQALQQRLQELQQRFGRVWHINCHSMKSRGNAMNIDAGALRADMVVGDLRGSSCHPEFSRCVIAELQSLGYQVAHNDPYQGGDIVRRYGDPGAGRHCLQIEINRALYLDEKRCEKTPGYETLRNNLQQLCGRVTDFIKQQLKQAPGSTQTQ